LQKIQVFWLSVGMCLFFLPSALEQTDIMCKHMLSSKYVRRSVIAVKNWKDWPSIRIQQSNFTASLQGNTVCNRPPIGGILLSTIPNRAANRRRAIRIR